MNISVFDVLFNNFSDINDIIIFIIITIINYIIKINVIYNCIAIINYIINFKIICNVNIRINDIKSFFTEEKLIKEVKDLMDIIQGNEIGVSNLDENICCS
jgi:hypothetical protein